MVLKHPGCLAILAELTSPPMTVVGGAAVVSGWRSRVFPDHLAGLNGILFPRTPIGTSPSQARSRVELSHSRTLLASPGFLNPVRVELTALLVGPNSQIDFFPLAFRFRTVL